MATEAIADEPRKRGVLARVLCVVLLVLACLALVVVNLLVWVDRTVLDTATFTSTTDKALSEPAVEQRLSDVIAQRLVESEDFSSRIEARLPADLAFATPIVEQQLKSLITQISLEVLSSNIAESVRVGIIDRLHARIVALLEGNSGALEVEGNRLVIDLRSPLESISARLDRPVPQRLQSAENAEIVLLKDTTWLRRLSDFVQHRQEIILGALALAVACLGGAVLTAASRRRGVTLVGVAIILSGVITLIGIWGLNSGLSSAAEERVVLTELVNAFETNLKLQSVIIILIGAAIALVADERSRFVVSRAESAAKSGVEQIGVLGCLAITAFVVILIAFL